MAKLIQSTSSFHCPYCNCEFPPIGKETYSAYETNFSSCNDLHKIYPDPSSLYRSESPLSKEAILVKFYKCPRCNHFSIIVEGKGSLTEGLTVPILPKSKAIQFPEYVPQSIRNDYEEACSIVFLSPKASATLSRRCLQSMIRNFWGICANNLYQEISALREKVDSSQWQVLNAIRELGNIGAHSEEDINLIIDIEPENAEKLVKTIELLINDWYISRHEQEQLYDDVLSLKDAKKAQKSN